MWDQLPELILTLIFDHLECRDRFNVDRTCQSWSRALAAPVLWRSITITIDRDLRGDLSPTKQLVVSAAQLISHQLMLILLDESSVSFFLSLLSWLLLLLQAKYGQYIRKLEFAWSRPYILPRETRATWNIRAKEGIEFIGVIKDKTVQLNQLVLTNWFFGTNWNHRSKLLYAVGHFLR